MSWPALQEIDAQVQQLAEQVHEGNARVWQLTGDLSAGKTTTLKRLHTLFLKSGKRSILLDPPVGELDAGVTALAQLASQLGNGAKISWFSLRNTHFFSACSLRRLL